MTAPASPDAAADKPAVLFVDDDAMVCRSMGRCLERQGFAVTTVTSGEQALVAIRDHRYAAVVTDHNMPAMTGVELIERLIAIDPSLRGRIILTSGDLYTESNNAFLQRTGTRGLQKPFQVSELAQAVKAAASAATHAAA